MNIRTTTAFATGAVFALVLGTGTAYAANGGHFVLGGNNYESREASLNNSNGTALTLRSSAGHAPLKVNRTNKVVNLNADLVDGLNSSQIARVVTVGTRTSAGFVYDNETPAVPGDDLVVAVTECPAGTQVMGGGADNLGDGVLVSSFPDTSEEPDAWVAISSAAPTDENAADFQGFARCWDPNGNVADADTNRQAAPRALSPSARKLIAK